VRRGAEHRLELADQMKWRDADLARKSFDRERMLTFLEEEIASAAQPPEPFMSEEHLLKCSRWSRRVLSHESHDDWATRDTMFL
jgi:hypothetical protein